MCSIMVDWLVPEALQKGRLAPDTEPTLYHILALGEAE